MGSNPTLSAISFLVTSETLLLDTAQSQLSQTYTPEQVTQLPYSGPVDNLALLTPGVIAPPTGFAFTNGVEFSSNGNRTRSNNFQLDGQDNNLGTGAFLPTAACALALTALAAGTATSGRSQNNNNGSNANGNAGSNTNANTRNANRNAGGQRGTTGSGQTGAGQGGTSSSADTQFMTRAAMMDMAEIQTGRLAVSQGASESVRQFGQRMIDDHTRTSRQLMQMASTAGFTPPPTLDAKHQAAAAKLARLTGAEFDRAYMKQMVKDHQEAVSLYQRQSTRGTMPDLRSFASATLPALQEHLTMARSMAGGSGGGSMNHNGNTNSGGAANANTNSNR